MGTSGSGLRQAASWKTPSSYFPASLCAFSIMVAWLNERQFQIASPNAQHEQPNDTFQTRISLIIPGKEVSCSFRSSYSIEPLRTSAPLFCSTHIVSISESTDLSLHFGAITCSAITLLNKLQHRINDTLIEGVIRSTLQY
jgi:hypothetical protein